MSKMTDLMDQWLEKNGNSIRPVTQISLEIKEEPIKHNAASNTSSHYMKILIEKEKELEERAFYESIKERSKIDWNYARRNSSLLIDHI